MVTQIIPKLPYINKEETLKFYTEKLRYKLISDSGDYFIMTVDSEEIHFFEFKNLDPKKSDFMIYLRIENIENFYENLQTQNVKIHPNGKLETKPWKQKEFSILDPNGTLLTFGESQ